MNVYLVTMDYYFRHGLISACQQNNVDVIPVAWNDISVLWKKYRIHESDTLVITLDIWRGRLMEYITSLEMLSSLNMKIIFVSEGRNHIRRVGGYKMSKFSPFPDYIKIFSLPAMNYEHAVRRLSLSVRDKMLLGIFYCGLPDDAVRLLAGENTKKIYAYKAQMLRSLGIRRLNYLYQMF